MKILMISQYYYPEKGAAQARLQFYAEYFSQKGHSVTVLTTAPNYPNGKVLAPYKNRFRQKEQINGVNIVRTWFWEDASKTMVGRLKWFISFMVSSLLAGMMLPRYDVILVESPPIFTPISAVIIRFFKKSSVVIHLSDLWVEAAINFGFLRPGSVIARIAQTIEKKVLSSADVIVTVSQGCIEFAQKILHNDRILLAQNGVDIDLYRKRKNLEDLKKQIGLSGKFVVTYAGTMGFVHDLDVIIDAARELQTIDETIFFLLIGDGSEKERITSRAKEIGLVNIRFMGLLDQNTLVDYLSMSSIGVSTIRKADFSKVAIPVKIFTYMACELPIVASDWGESAEIMKKSSCGFVAECGNGHALASRILELKNNSNLESIGHRGRIFVEKNYSRSISADKILNKFEELNQKKKPVSFYPSKLFRSKS